MTETRRKKIQNQSYSLKAQKRKLDEKIRSLESVIVEIKDKFSLPEGNYKPSSQFSKYNSGGVVAKSYKKVKIFGLL